MKCTNCKAELLNGAQFCLNCGMRQPLVNQPQTAQYTLKYDQYYEQVTSRSEKSWVMAFYIICFLTAGLVFPKCL